MNLQQQAAEMSQDVTIIEQKMATLERENFDLKMKLFYKEKEALKGTSTLENEAERVVGILQARDDTYDQLRRANEEAYNTIADLRAELQLVKAGKDSSNSVYENMLQKNQRLASLQLEENLKRERQAAQAIASHDAALIAKLENEVEKLKETHEADNKLVSECAGRVAELMGVIEEKNATIEEKTAALDVANEHIEALKDRISQQELFLIRGDQHDLLPKKSVDKLRIEGPHSMQEPKDTVVQPPQRRDISSNSPHFFDMTANMNPATTRRSMSSPRSPALGFSMEHPTSPMQRNREYMSPSPGLRHRDSYDDDDAVGSSMTLKPAPRLGQPFMTSQEDSHYAHHQYSPSQHRSSDIRHRISSRNSNIHVPRNSHIGSESNSRHFSLADLSNTAGTSSGMSNKPHRSQFHGDPFPQSPIASYQNTPPTFNDSFKRTPSLPNVAQEDFDTRPYDEDSKSNSYLSDEAKKLIAVEIERDAFRDECEALKQMLNNEKDAFKKLEDTLARVRSSSEEITLLEAEEIARLEEEIERITEERDKYKSSTRSLEVQIELLQQRLREDDRGFENGRQYENGHVERFASNRRNGEL